MNGVGHVPLNPSEIYADNRLVKTRHVSFWVTACLFVVSRTCFAMDAKTLGTSIRDNLSKVAEFRLIQEEAKKRGLRVWLFGGTAAAYAHYVKTDLEQKSGIKNIQADRLDYDYTNIFRSTQDLDIVVDGEASAAKDFEAYLEEATSYVQGAKSEWEVRSLRHTNDTKAFLIGKDGLASADFSNQHTDSHSTGLIEITDPPTGESAVLDLLDLKNKEPQFLKDVAQSKLHYYFSDKHSTTKRFREGKNPPILSVIRYLTKAFQYKLELRPEDLMQIQKIVDDFDPKTKKQLDEYVVKWIEKNGKKLFQNAVDIEYAWNTLEKIGLRKKLISFSGTQDQGNLGWWLNKEPLRSNKLGLGKGKTVASLIKDGTLRANEKGEVVLAHETGDFLAYESITRSHEGFPNVFVSRENAQGEAAVYGWGFYTAQGTKGARGSEITIRFKLKPDAREGTDFIVAPTGYVVLRNRNALEVIPEQLDWNFSDYLKFLLNSNDDNSNELALLEKLKRRLKSQLSTASGQALGDESFQLFQTFLSEAHSMDPESLHRIEIARKELAEKFGPKVPHAALEKIDSLIEAHFSKVEKYRIEKIKNLNTLRPYEVHQALYDIGADLDQPYAKSWKTLARDYYRAVVETKSPRQLAQTLTDQQLSNNPHLRKHFSSLLDASAAILKSKGEESDKVLILNRLVSVAVNHKQNKLNFDPNQFLNVVEYDRSLETYYPDFIGELFSKEPSSPETAKSMMKRLVEIQKNLTSGEVKEFFENAHPKFLVWAPEEYKAIVKRHMRYSNSYYPEDSPMFASWDSAKVIIETDMALKGKNLPSLVGNTLRNLTSAEDAQALAAFLRDNIDKYWSPSFVYDFMAQEDFQHLSDPQMLKHYEDWAIALLKKSKRAEDIRDLSSFVTVDEGEWTRFRSALLDKIEVKPNHNAMEDMLHYYSYKGQDPSFFLRLFKAFIKDFKYYDQEIVMKNSLSHIAINMDVEFWRKNPEALDSLTTLAKMKSDTRALGKILDAVLRMSPQTEDNMLRALHLVDVISQARPEKMLEAITAFRTKDTIRDWQKAWPERVREKSPIRIAVTKTVTELSKINPSVVEIKKLSKAYPILISDFACAKAFGMPSK